MSWRGRGFEDVVEVEQALGYHGVVAQHVEVVAVVKLVHPHGD